MHIGDNRPANILLGQLVTSDLCLLQPHLERVALKKGVFLSRSGEPIRHLHFLHSGIASIVSDRRDEVRVELAVIGKEGVTGIAGLLGATSAPHETMLQVDHAYADRVELSCVTSVMDRSSSFRHLMLRFVQTVLIQISGNAAANVSDRLNARLARWLLMCHDRVEGEDIPLTHEFMAAMIGAPRSAVTTALHDLESVHAIHTQRGRVVITDRTGLEALAGAGYGTPEAEYRRLIAPFGKSRNQQPQDREIG